jgi:hypothetical protein
MPIKFLKDPNQKIFYYIVSGEPIPLCKVTDEDSVPKVWDAYKDARFKYIQRIKNQHEKYFEKCCFEEGAINRRQFVPGPLKLEATFFMRSYPPRLRKKEKTEKYEGEAPTIPHDRAPPIFSLFNFLDRALQGVIYKRDCTLSSVQIRKVYDRKPRTEITITRIK